MSTITYKRERAGHRLTARQRIARRDHTIVAIVACMLALIVARLHAPEWLPLLLIGIAFGAALRLAITAESEHGDG